MPDGAPLALGALDPARCRGQAHIPLERFLREDDAVLLAMDAAVACVVRELVDWIDRP
jgi:hypothetical protein